MALTSRRLFMHINYDNRVFRSVENSSGGDVDRDTLFHYRQEGNVVWATYQGGTVRFGTLIALVLTDGRLHMRYQHVSRTGRIRTGRCLSTPELLSDGRLRLHESWCWTEDGQEQGQSIVEEVKPS